MKRYLTCITLLFAANSLFAEEAEKVQAAVGSGDLKWDMLIIAFVATILVLLLVAVTLLKTFNSLSKEFLKPTPLVKEEVKPLEYLEWARLQKEKPGITSRILGLRPISEEKDILIEHDFDGITELDNPTPAWFMWLFYATIVIAVGYMLHYHVFEWGQLQDEEYATEIREAEAEKKAYLAKSANLIDENTVKENSDAAVISSGQAIFNTNCVACHGDKGQGVVGPNLTDNYWLHGAKINDVFKSIKYGIPEKGMISWEKTLSPKQIAEVANFINSLKGSNPPNAKAPQGEKEG
ncbi:cbb3-type cytochrome c oxidase N-terminal domain-containing protein [Pedobacter sp. P351]|uniref:cbb3-type cytochrome c oxidase N-terminal domain-containing protein n=1 Tax=Pedobacter superstes TaxID=3133441 RepID=UPI0030A72380